MAQCMRSPTIAESQRSRWQRVAMWTLLGWSSFQTAWLLALTGGFATGARPGELESGIAVALLIIGGLWALDRFVRNAYVGIALNLVTILAAVYVLNISYFSGCLDWCRPWLGFLGLPTLVALAGSATIGLTVRRTWAWAGLAVSPITLFFLAAITLPRTGLLATTDPLVVVLGLVVSSMAAIWASIGITARECLSWRRPAEA